MVSYIEVFNKQRLYDLKQFVLLFRNNNLKTNFQSQRVFFFFNSSVPCQSPKNKFPITENVDGECKEFCGRGTTC